MNVRYIQDVAKQVHTMLIKPIAARKSSILLFVVTFLLWKLDVFYINPPKKLLKQDLYKIFIYLFSFFIITFSPPAVCNSRLTFYRQSDIKVLCNFLYQVGKKMKMEKVDSPDNKRNSVFPHLLKHLTTFQ